MILSTTEAKTYLQITSTDYDTLISAFIPVAIQDFFEYTNNYFDNNAFRVVSADVTASSSEMTMVLGNTNFSTYSFVDGDDFRVRNSKRNDGYYIADSVSSATLTVVGSSVYIGTSVLKDETALEAEWIINKIDVPISVKPLLASMIKFKIDHPIGTPQSESLGDYSVTYGGGPYPESIMKDMSKYRLVKFT